MRTTLVAICAAVCVCLAGCGAENDESIASSSDELATMTLTGDVSAVYKNGRFVVFDPSKKVAQTTSMGMSATVAPATSTTTTSAPAKPIGMTAASTTTTSAPAKPIGMTAARTTTTSAPTAAIGMATAVPADNTSSEPRPNPSDAVYESLNVIAEAEIGEDGSFSLTTSVSDPQPVYFYVLYATSETGHSLAPVKGQHFILEPGNLTLTMDTRSRFVVDGGYYNDEVFNAWRQSQAYIDANNQYGDLIKSVEGESEDQRRARSDASSEAMNRILDLETEGRKHITSTHPDPVVRKLTLETTWLTGPWYGNAISALAKDMPDDPWVKDALERHEAAEIRRAQQAQFVEGNQIQDFEAFTLAGTNHKFSEVREESKLVLLEFWASWCGPCIAEIPHMKQAYDRFKPKGFEIVSFTIDEEREDWELASEEQNIPWIDLGMGPDAPAATAYGVTGVPKNFLVDAETGVIVATDLRQHKLDEKLEEVLL